MLTLLHTNDYHNRLTEPQIRRLMEWRQTIGAEGLLLDAGDAVAAGNITFRPGGEPILEAMGRIGYDAMTVGNREFHFTRVGFHSKLSRATFPILCANIRLSAKRGTADTDIIEPASLPVTSSSDPPVLSYIVRELTMGWRVVVFGVTVPMITERMLVRKASSYVFDSPIDTAARLVPRLRAQYTPDLLIALTHIGIQQDRLLATQVSGIDLIIGGHTHLALNEGERVGETLIVQAGSHGKYIGRVLAKKADGNIHLAASLETL